MMMIFLVVHGQLTSIVTSQALRSTCEELLGEAVWGMAVYVTLKLRVQDLQNRERITREYSNIFTAYLNSLKMRRSFNKLWDGHNATKVPKLSN